MGLFYLYLFIYNNSARCQAKPNSADNATKLKGSLKKKKKKKKKAYQNKYKHPTYDVKMTS